MYWFLQVGSPLGRFFARSLSGLEKVMILDEKELPNQPKSLEKRFRKRGVFRRRFLIDFWLTLGAFRPPKSVQK